MAVCAKCGEAIRPKALHCHRCGAPAGSTFAIGRRLFLLVLIAIVVTAIGFGISGRSGRGDSHESLAGEGQSTMNEMVSVLDGMKDEASAKSAKPKLTSLMDRLNDINQRQSRLPTPTEAEIKAMGAKYGKQMEELQKKFMGHMMRIAFDPKINAQLADIEQHMKKTMR